MHQIRFELISGLQSQYCRLDPSRFNQAIVNLLSNAAKFSPPASSVRIDVALSGSDMVTIAVSDEGQGIPEAFRDKIFQRFAQADSSATRAKGGSGLGLNITKSIIEAFDGTLAFESEEGKGTTFMISLPICAMPDHEGDAHCQTG